MPQDIPVEASETLAFTPDCLANLEVPPIFTLRAVTTRDKRWMRRIVREQGAVQHGVDALRAEMLKGLQALWNDFETHAPKVRDYWDATDQFALQQKDDPDLVFEYDPDIEAAVQQLERDTAQHHPPLARMRADNAYSAEVFELGLVAVALLGWSGMPTAPERDRGYLTIDCIEKLKNELGKLAEDAKVDRGTAWAQLFVACTLRMFFDEDESKNSASPSPSVTPPESSNPGKGATNGKSPAPASSTETPASA